LFWSSRKLRREIIEDSRMILIAAALDTHVRSLRTEILRASIRDANAAGARWIGNEHLRSLHSMAGSRAEVAGLIQVAGLRRHAYLDGLAANDVVARRAAALLAIDDLEVALA
jgi:hypothetical protein